MQFLGIGPLEFILIAVIALIVLGPQGIVRGAREAGKFIRKLTRSPLWRDVMDTSREIREIPQKIMREAGIEQDLEDLKRSTRGTISEIKQSGSSELPKAIKPHEPPPDKQEKREP